MPRTSPDERGETLDRICGALELFQARRGYRFGIEALLLAGFVKPGARRLVDLGSGSGVLPLVLVRFGKVGSAVGVELQKALADRARRSVVHNRLGDRIEILQADLRRLEGVLPAGAFDLATANPPYGRPGEGRTNTDDERARGRHELAGGLADFLAAAARLLRPLGRLAAVLPPERLPEWFLHAESAGLRPARLRLVHPFADRPPRHALVEARRGGRGKLTAEPPLILYEKQGLYTAEVQAMLYPAGNGS